MTFHRKNPRIRTARAVALALVMLAGLVIAACGGSGAGSSNGGFDQAAPSGAETMPAETTSGY